MSSSLNPNVNKNLGGDIVGSILQNPQVQQTIITGIFGLFGSFFKGLIDKLTKKRPPVAGPSNGGGFLDPNTEVPDDKIIIPPPPSKLKDYTSLKLSTFKAQYNHELFPDQYDPAKGGNKDGLYRPARQDVYNRRSKIWCDCTPFKGSHAVQTEEGRQDGILWTPVWHFFYNGVESKCYANKNQLHDTANGEGRPIQMVEGDSVKFGFSSWDFAHGFLCQINVGDNEGDYEVWVEIPELNKRSDSWKFKVS